MTTKGQRGKGRNGKSELCSTECSNVRKGIKEWDGY